MSSILTNTSAMVALQTLRAINANLATTQSQISTGKAVDTAKDNAAVWAISKVMDSDVKGFERISDSLALGDSTVSVARKAAETINDLLTDMKGNIVAAQESNVDRDKIQNDVDALRDQILSVVGAAQFNGLNLIEGTDDVDILSSLDRQSDGAVNANSITINRQDMTADAGVYGKGATLDANIKAAKGTIDGTGVAHQLDLTLGGSAKDALSLSVNGKSFSVAYNKDLDTTIKDAAGAINALGLTGVTATAATGGKLSLVNTNSFEDFRVTLDAGGTNTIAIKNNGNTGQDRTTASKDLADVTLVKRAEAVSLSKQVKVNDGDSYSISVKGKSYGYIAGKGETMEQVARGLKTAIDGGDLKDVSTQVGQAEDGSWQVLVDYQKPESGAPDTVTLAAGGKADGTASGGLFGLSNIDVTTDKGADAALGNIEALIQNSIKAAASFGSVQGRINTQATFISDLSDAMTAGIGSMVDADMEEASARLQALQTQQQLGLQALSIANQQPQNILSLFR